MMNSQEDSGMILKMSDINEQMVAPEGGFHGHGQRHEGQGQLRRADTEGLPMESSPYVKYTDLEDYKRKGYGTEGHLEPKPIQNGSGTDAPTISGKSIRGGLTLDTPAPRRNL